VVARHKKRGHDVASLADLRRLDLQQIDAVRGRAASWYYPAGAALSGAGAGLVISGGQLVIAASAGAAAAPPRQDEAKPSDGSPLHAVLVKRSAS
jgi:hypothetical protein